MAVWRTASAAALAALLVVSCPASVAAQADLAVVVDCYALSVSDRDAVEARARAELGAHGMTRGRVEFACGPSTLTVVLEQPGSPSRLSEQIERVGPVRPDVLLRLLGTVVDQAEPPANTQGQQGSSEVETNTSPSEAPAASLPPANTKRPAKPKEEASAEAARQAAPPKEDSNVLNGGRHPTSSDAAAEWTWGVSVGGHLELWSGAERLGIGIAGGPWVHVADFAAGIRGSWARGPETPKGIGISAYAFEGVGRWQPLGPWLVEATVGWSRAEVQAPTPLSPASQSRDSGLVSVASGAALELDAHLSVTALVGLRLYATRRHVDLDEQELLAMPVFVPVASASAAFRF